MAATIYSSSSNNSTLPVQGLVVWMSRVLNKEKGQGWRDRGEQGLMFLPLPFRNLQLYVVDDEHSRACNVLGTVLFQELFFARISV
jgi:hypothetical protein